MPELLEDIEKLFLNSTRSQKILSRLWTYSWDDYKKYVVFDEKNYSRKYIHTSQLFEVLIVSWLPGQKTKLHGHPKAWWYIKVLEWSLWERLFDTQGIEIKQSTFSSWDLVYEHDDIGFHILENKTNIPAVSLHIYSPGNYKPDAGGIDK